MQMEAAANTRIVSGREAIPKLNGPPMFPRKKVGIEQEQIWGQKARDPVWWWWKHKWWGQIRAESWRWG